MGESAAGINAELFLRRRVEGVKSSHSKEPRMKHGSTRPKNAAAALMISLAAVAGLAPGVYAETPAPTPQVSAAAPAKPQAKRPDPKPLSDNVKKGLDWLAKTQAADGGWTQGEAVKTNGRSGEPIDRSDVADTCMAALALIRAGNTPAKGDYASNIRKALEFVCGEVEKSSDNGLLITDIRVTRVQTKLGSTVDTFASALLLAECRNTMPDEASRKRVVAALDKVMDKIEKSQKEDGRIVDAHDGWAGALCQGLCHKALNVAAQNGAKVSEPALARAEKYNGSNFDSKSRSVAGAGSANVELYARASNLGAFQDSENTNKVKGPEYQKRRDVAQKQHQAAEKEVAAAREAKDEKRLKVATTQAAKAADEIKVVEQRLVDVKANAESLDKARAAVVDRLNDKGFIAGFGSNGGEEFLSYMNIGESLVQKGGEEFTKFDKSMAENLNRVQNEDGSWSGQHCITGRTFCTAAAPLTLTVDRSGMPVGAMKAVPANGQANAR
jgi:hypothetical protein